MAHPVVDLVIVDARRFEQQHVECHLHALSHLQMARQRGITRIRVDKPGHTCEFSVPALIAYCQAHPAAAPKCLVTVTEAGHRAAGGTVVPWRRVWSSGDVAPPSSLVAVSGAGLSEPSPGYSGIC